MRISDWSSDVVSSDLIFAGGRRKRRKASGIAGNAKILAAPAYERLLAVEPILKRSIPLLIIIFLVVIAAARVLSMLTWRDSVEQDAKEIGRASCRERVGQYVYIPVVAVTLKKK